MSVGHRHTKRLCIHWPRLGPYHIARLKGAHHQALTRDASIVALETAGNDTTYAWAQENESLPFQRETVFRDQIYEDLPAADLHQGVTAALDKLQPDAVAITSYSTPDARASLIWCKQNRKAAILMSETKEDDAAREAWREWVKAKLVDLFDAAFVGGTPHQAYLEKLGFPYTHIFQGCDAVDNTYFETRTAEIRRKPSRHTDLPGLQDPSPFFLASNRFVARKNLSRLIRAYAMYRERTSTPWRLLLLGDGPERPALESMVADKKIAGVNFCGFRQIEELPAYYARARVFVHPALIEQWGLVVNEAMAAGLPVLVSERAGCAHNLVEQDINGFTFDPLNTNELANLLTNVSDPHTDLKAMGKASKEIIANWSPERFGRQIWAAADAALQRSSRRIIPGKLLLWLVQRSSRQVHSFHSVRD